MSFVIKIVEIRGEPTEDNHWHYTFDFGGAEGLLCSGQVFRFGDEETVYEDKEGKITCPKCIKIIKHFKAIKL